MIGRTICRVIAWVALCTLLVGCKKEQSTSSSAPAATKHAELYIAAAADLQFTLATVSEQFHASHPEIDVKITYGSSGNFFSQITNHAPFDLFLSADTSYPEKLLAGGEAAKGSEFKYAVGRIVLWAPNGSNFDPARRHMAALEDPALRKLAIANPDHAPYGRAAEAALKKAGLWDGLQPKIVMGGNISDTATMARTGAADMGIIALSLARAPQMKDAGTYYEIPPEDYPTMTQEGVILSYAKNPREAEQFKTFLLGREARETLAEFGFGIPKE